MSSPSADKARPNWPVVGAVLVVPVGVFLLTGNQFGVISLAIFLVLESLAAGLWFGFGQSGGARPPFRHALGFAGAVFVINGFVLFLGCSPGSQQTNGPRAKRRPDATSSKEMALTAAKIPPRDPHASSELLTLTPYYNAPLDEDWWTEFGPANLAALPKGVQTFAGVQFDVRGVVRLCSQPRFDDWRKFPTQVRGIVVRRRCQTFHFLHGCFWKATDLEQIAQYIVRYADGGHVEVPIRFGREVSDSARSAGTLAEQEEFAKRGGIIAWETRDERPPRGRRVFLTNWRNPRPEVEITNLDIETNTRIFTTPFLLAVTVQPAD